jgi:hypothetical protein
MKSSTNGLISVSANVHQNKIVFCNKIFMEIRINIGGEITDVHINFFINKKIIREEKVGDTYFITIENGEYSLTYSIHQNYYDKVKVELRNLKIDNILD